MIKMQWVITEDLSNITLEQFDNEWNGVISGYFALSINEITEGCCPNEGEIWGDGLEDIVYWLSHLYDGLNKVNQGKEYEMILLTMNRYKLLMKLKEKLVLSFVNKITLEVEWNEEVDFQEFQDELCRNIKKFSAYIKEVNASLLNSKWLSRWCWGDEIECLPTIQH